MENVKTQIRSRVAAAKVNLTEKRHKSGWIMPKQTASFAPEGTWSNIDMDVTPEDRRIWTPVSIMGYWISDVVGIFQNECEQRS